MSPEELSRGDPTITPGSVTIQGDMGSVIIPGSITIVQTPDYVPTGAITISSSLDFYVSSTHQSDFSWRVEGLAEKEISFQWNVGEGEYYWYRVEGECGKVNCENTNVDASQCNNVTFVTVVPARNVAEVCEALKSPRINPPVNLRVAVIKRYSRPVLKGSVPDEQCNTLEDQEFCHIPECLDYCVDEEIETPAVMSMSSIDFLESRQMSGGFALSGSSETNRNRRYSPVFPLAAVTGSSVCAVNLRPEVSGSIALAGTSSKTVSQIFFECMGSVSVSGSSRATSPHYNFSSVALGFSFSGSGFIRRRFVFDLVQQGTNIQSEGGLNLMTEEGEYLLSELSYAFSVTGSSESNLSARFLPSASIEVGGMAGDYVSPSRFYRPESGFMLEGQAERNFTGLGAIVASSSMEMTCSDFASDFNDLSYTNGLTISEFTVNPSCGCGPLGLSLVLRHNLSGSSVINNFLNKNNKSLPSSILMKYRSSDTSWQSNSQFSSANESLSILFSLACMDDVWRLSFSARKSSGGRTSQTKFILDMPSESICSDGNISTRINLGTGYPTVEGIPVVSPAHTTNIISPRGVAVVDGLIFDYVVYYDEIGIFKDSYWSRTPFDIYIEPLNRPEMQSVDLERILP